MKKSDKELKQRMRGMKQLKEALTTLRWKALPVETMGYIIGDSIFVTTAAEIIKEALTPPELEKQDVQKEG